MSKEKKHKIEILMLFLLSVFVFLIYSNNLNGPFVFDDEKCIKDNFHIRLTKLTLEGIKKAGFESHHSNRPLANISFALNYYFHQYRLKGYHLVNNIIHIATGIFLYLFLKSTLSIPSLRSLYGYHQPQNQHSNLDLPRSFISSLRSSILWIPFFAASIWLVHPIQTQSVSYIVQRMNSMATMFYILSLLLYVKARLSEKKNKTRFFIIGSLFSGLLALGSKEISATLPFFIFLYEWYFFQELSWTWLKRHLSLLIGTVILIVLLSFIYLGTHPLEGILSSYESWHFTLTQRLLTQFRVVTFYISLLIFPHPSRLNLDHDFLVSNSLLDPITTLLSIGFISGLIGFAIYMAKKEPLFSFCIFWFLGNLVIESSIISLEIIFEHRTYLPSTLLILMLIILLYRHTKPKWLSIGVLSVVVIVFSVWTYERNNVWSDSVSLWKNCVAKSPKKARPHHNLGLALAKQGRFDEAISQYSEAMQINPGNSLLYNSLGNALASQGKLQEAIHHYNLALKINPDYGMANNNLGFALARQGHFKEAIDHYNEAIRINPMDETAHDNLGFAFLRLGNLNKAVHHYSEALRIKPHSSKAHNNLGHALARQGKLNIAIPLYHQALRINPNDVLAHNNLGLAFAKQEEFQEAILQYSIELRINPGFYWAHNNMGMALSKLERYEEAIRHYSQALRIKPDFKEARQNLDDVMGKMKDK